MKLPAREENVSKKRGRPRRYTDGELAALAIFPDVKSTRGKQNIVHQSTAINALGPDGEFAWIWPSHAEINKGAEGRMTILQHLGRLEDPDDIRTVAKHICDHKLKTLAAIDYIRRVTGRKRQPADGVTLFKALAKALDSYHDTHDWNYQIIHSALTGLLETVSEMEAKHETTSDPIA